MLGEGGGSVFLGGIESNLSSILSISMGYFILSPICLSLWGVVPGEDYFPHLSRWPLADCSGYYDLGGGLCLGSFGAVSLGGDWGSREEGSELVPGLVSSDLSDVFGGVEGCVWEGRFFAWE